MSAQETGMGETAAERGFPPAMSNTSSGGANDAVRAPQRQSEGIGADTAMLAQLDHAYQTHCTDCYMGALEWCEDGLAPNGQRCATTDAELLLYFRDVAKRLLQQRDAADAENAALTARLAEAEGQRDAARGAIRDLLWIVHHGELRGAEGMAMIHGFGYSPQFLAETTRKRQAAERLVGWDPLDGR